MIGLRRNVDSIKRTLLIVPPRRGEGETGVKITGTRPSGRGLGVRICCISSVFLGGSTICRLYKSNLSDQAHLTVQLRVIIVDLASRIWACLPLLRARKFFFRWGLKLLSATLFSDPGRNRNWSLQHTTSTTTYWANPVHSINYAPYSNN